MKGVLKCLGMEKLLNEREMDFSSHKQQFVKAFCNYAQTHNLELYVTITVLYNVDLSFPLIYLIVSYYPRI